MIPKQGTEEALKKAEDRAGYGNIALPQDYRDVSNQEIFKNHVLCAQIMLLNKIQTAEDLHRVLDMPADAVNRIVSKSPEHVLDIILDVIYLLCRKVNLSGEETHEMLSQLKEGRNMGYLFENMEHMDIQEERRKTREAREELERVRAENREMLSRLKEGQNMGYLFENMEHMDIQEERRKTREAREELEQFRKKAEEELKRTQAELANALKELEHYREAEKAKHRDL